MMPTETVSALTAAQVMTPGPRTCSTFSTVLEAVLIFRDADCGAVPVLDDCKPVGLLTDRDVALAVAEHGDNLGSLPVTELMTNGVVAVAPSDGIEAIAAKFTDEGVRRLLVIDSEGQLVGIISWADIAAYFPKQRIGQVVADVVAQP
jgi:CBS domain-containing protein